MKSLNVHFLPEHVEATALAGSTVVVIDMLRASSTICQALASGATCVMPFLEVEETLAAADRYSRGDVVLGGERHGKIIEHFNLGNSPLEYTPQTVLGKRVLFTTTNGTRALAHAAAAERVLVGCGLNRQAIAAAVAAGPRVDILCAGTDGAITGEDILAAGAIVDLVFADQAWELNVGAQESLSQWQSLRAAAAAGSRTLSQQLALDMRDTPGGRNLLAIGHDQDLVACAALDQVDIVPALNRTTGEIRASVP